MAIGSLVRCVFAPRLYRIYRQGDERGSAYNANIMEAYSDTVVKSISVAWSVIVYTCPFIITVLYKKGFYSVEGIFTLGRFAGYISLLLLGSLCIRSIGRYSNGNYMNFLSVLEKSQKILTKENKIALSRYDFEFLSWPVEFTWNSTQNDKSKPKVFLKKQTSKRSSILDNIKALPCQVLSYLAIHTFGRRMVYPGSVKLLQAAVENMLIQGRTKLIEKYGGERFKLLACDGNEIDTVVIDRRGKEFAHGNILVICCEGNAGFYEYGIMGTPLEAGFSVLGWNHPGFAGSTGIPFPDNEANAIDVVMQFSINKLEFKPENIIIYAWSIGGYSATWGAMNYPDIGGLVLDATFDDLLPLAVSRMPPSWKPLVVRTIRDYMNLNNGEQLCKYPGPVLLVRRTQDEMISTKDTSPLQTNRGNNLLMKLLQCRYPKLVTDETAWALTDWLAGDSTHQTELWNQQGVEEDLCLATLKSYVEENSPFFPMNIGEGMSLSSKVQLILFLAQKHMIDFDSTHCPPLPPELFQIPWKLDYNGYCMLNDTLHDDIYIVNKL